LTRFGAEVKDAANAACAVIHPLIPELNHIYGTIIDGPPGSPDAHQANCCIFADRQVDRSPTGSGTAGRVAQLYFRGQLPAGRVLVNESIIGSRMRGKVLAQTRVGDLDAVIPEISGDAHLCGFASWLIDPTDPLSTGFLVR